MRPAIPDAVSRWPMLPLTEPIAICRTPSLPYMAAIDEASIGSPTGVPVPWASKKTTESGGTPKRLWVVAITSIWALPQGIVMLFVRPSSFAPSPATVA